MMEVKNETTFEELTFSSLINNYDLSGFPVVVFSFDMKLAYCTSSFKRISGLQITETVKADDIFPYLPDIINNIPDEENKLHKRIHDSLLFNRENGFIPVQIVIYNITLNGDHFYLIAVIKSSPVENQSIKEYSDYFSSIIQLLPEAAVILQQNKIVFMNPTAKKLVSSIQGDAVSLFTSNKTGQNSRSINSKLQFAKSSRNISSIEETVRLTDGSILELEITETSTIIDGQQSTLLYIRNISDEKRFNQELETYKQSLEKIVQSRTAELQLANERLNNEIAWRTEAEDELALKDERLNLAVEVSHYGLWDINFINDSIYCDDRFATILGVKQEDLRKFDINAFQSIIHNQELDQFQMDFKKHLRKETEVFECEHRIRTKQGLWKWVSVKGKIVQWDRNGEPLRFIGRLEDITPRKQTEEKIQSAFLREKELSELKSRFISMVSHEYRTPLATILSSAEILDMYDNELSTNEKKEHIQRVISCVEAMTEMLDDVITINKYDMGKAEVQTSKFDVVSFSRQLIHEMTSLFEKVPDIRFNSTEENFIITTSDRLYKQIFVNLLTNAIKYTPSDKKVMIYLVPHATTITLEVKDEGIGIHDDDQKSLFEPFFRGKNVGMIPGSGLGLQIVKRSVELMKGRISFESHFNLGTSFKVEFPRYYV